MRMRQVMGTAACLMMLFAVPGWAGMGQDKPNYPPTREKVVVDDYHGVKIEDPYRWLEDGESEEVVKWTQDQNLFTRGWLDAVRSRGRIVKQLEALWDYPKMGTPQKRGGRLFYTHNDGLQNQSPLYVRDGLEGAPRLLIDPNTLSEDGTVAMDWYYVAESGNFVAYGTSPNGTEQSTLRVRDARTGEDLEDVIDGCRFSDVAWLEDDTGFYYTRFPKPGTVPDNERNYNHRVFFHRLGTDADTQDALIFAVPAKKEILFDIHLSSEERYLAVFASEGSSRDAEVYVKDLKGGGFLQLVRGLHDTYSGEIVGDTFYLRTNEGAPNGRIFAVDLKNPARSEWKCIVPEGRDAIEDAGIVNGKLLVQTLHNATSRILLYSLDGKPEGELPLPPMVSVYSLSGEWDDPELFVRFASFTMPASVHRYDFASKRLEVFFEPETPFDGEAFTTEQAWVPSKDGTKISMFLVHKKDLKKDGKAPVFLTGYGGFTVNMTPYYTPSIAWWISQGGIFAMPNLRGGSEYGEAWHEAGMLANKQNVFDDFIACGEWLIDNGYTSKSKLAIEGGSNGGLLTGAVLVQRPDLFGAVIIAVPLLDMLRYHLFSIARYWIPEYGSSEDPEQFEFIRAYSPYHNVKKGMTCPPTLIMTGASDNRVDPLHARKMGALLQRDAGGPGPLLLRVESKAGHGQGKPTRKRIEAAADEFAFLVRALDLKVKRRI